MTGPEVVMKYLFGIMCLLALGVMGCSDPEGAGGSGGSAGDGGSGGSSVACVNNVCSCDEAGIRTAIEAGGNDPYTFDCDGPQTVVTEAAIIIDTDVILDGEGNLTIDAGGEHLVVKVERFAETELRGVTVTGGQEELGGPCCAGILNYGTLTLVNTTVSGNRARNGGGGIVNEFGTLTLIDSTVSNNHAGDSGGGVLNHGSGTLTLINSTVSGNTARGGGGIVNDGALTLLDSTVSGNNAMGNGGGISKCNGTLTVTNSTVSSNSAALKGGAIFTFCGDADTTLTNATLAGNTAGLGGNGISNDPFGVGAVALRNSLVDGDCEGSLLSNGYNLESSGDTCGFDQGTDQVNVTGGQLKLGPLADNGGPTETHALLPGSVAIHVIPADMCEVDEDQRGEPRDSMCDVGAFEVRP
jgi:hypothetical protein